MKSSLVKLYLSDVGLLSCMYGNAMRIKILTGNGIINMGGIYENAVAQELNAHGFNAYFYNSHKAGEIDFVIEKDGEILPLEIKSGKDYYVHSAISKVVETKEYGISEAYVFADCNIKQEDKMVYYPVYLAGFVKNDVELTLDLFD